MTIRPFRICQNNLAAGPGASLTASSYVSGFPVENVLDVRRSKRLLFQGAFTVTAANKTIYIDDGSQKTITLTEATYTSGTALASHIQTQLNASSSNWTCSYSTSTFKFTIGRSSGTADLRLSETTDAAWSMLGYLGTVDVSAGTGLEADEQRNHTSEKITIDLGAARTINAFHLLGAARSEFGVSSVATMTLKGNSINSFDTPPFTVTLTGEIQSEGVSRYFDDEGDQTYRYWELEIIDRTNPAGPQMAIHYLYLGDYVAPTLRTLSVGFTRQLVDPSVISRTVAGNKFGRIKTKYWQWTAMVVKNLPVSDRVELERVFAELGTSYPFICSLDPGAAVSANAVELTKFMTFMSDPTIEHLVAGRYAISMEMEEVL